MHNSQVSNTASLVNSNNTTLSKPVVNNAIVKTIVSADNKGVLQVRHPQMNHPLSVQISVNQVQQLHQQMVVVLLHQQQLELFGQSQLQHQQIKLSPELMSSVRQWLMHSDKRRDFAALPTALLKQLAQLTQLAEPKMLLRLHTLGLSHNLLQISWLQGEPIAKSALPNTPTGLNAEQLQHVIQTFIPLGLNNHDSLLMKQQEPSHDEQDERTDSFELTFNLASLGTLIVKVKLQDFELTSQCIYSSIQLEQQVKRFWPKFSKRLAKLGFSVNNSFTFTPEVQTSNQTNTNTGIINTKA